MDICPWYLLARERLNDWWPTIRSTVMNHLLVIERQIIWTQICNADNNGLEDRCDLFTVLHSKIPEDRGFCVRQLHTRYNGARNNSTTKFHADLSKRQISF